VEKPDELLAPLQAFCKSRIIFTACELDLFTILHRNPLTAEKLAERLSADLRSLTRVLDCLATFDLLAKNQDRYEVTENGSLFSSRHPHTVLPMALHYAELWDRWSVLTDVVKNGPHQQHLDVLKQDPETFIGAMHAIGRRLSAEIAESYDLSPFTRLLDIGGALVTYTIAFLNRNPDLTATIFDLESVIPLAKKHIEAENLSHRVDFAAGDFYTDDLPARCDLALLSAIIHQNSPQQNIDLYTKVYQALEPGGVILIRDHIMDPSRTSPPQGAVFAVNMLVNTPGGDTYTFAEVQEHLETAGFKNVSLVRQDDRMGSLVEARKPA